MRKFLSFLIVCFVSSTSFSQAPIDIAENTVKVNALGGEQVFYYGFAEGDDIIFTMIETNGKELKEVEITEWPSSSKFSERKISRIENKTIHVNRTSIYKFRLYNSSVAGRNCKVKIQRVPASDATKNFNTNVYWKTIYDTSYYTVEEKYLVRSDTVAIPVFSQVIKISAKNTSSSATRKLVEFQLPANTKAWSAYIGVGDEGKEAHYEGRERFLNTISCKDSNFAGYGAMAATAFGQKNIFPKVKSKERIRYWWINDLKNAELFQQEKPFAQYREGYTAGEAMSIDRTLNGRAYLGLVNDGATELEVLVKATAVTVSDQYKTKTVEKMKINRTEEPYLKN